MDVKSNKHKRLHNFKGIKKERRKEMQMRFHIVTALNLAIRSVTTFNKTDYDRCLSN